jgi:hypothetical protein
MAMQALFSPELSVRRDALLQLEEMDAHLRSPLVISLLVHRLIEPDLQMRVRIVNMISAAIVGEEGSSRVPEKVRRYLRRSLNEMGDREILALLELLTTQEISDQLCYIFNECSTSGEQLARIVLNRKEDISTRIAASDVIAEVGFIEAKTAIESLELRLSNLMSGQIPMSFAPKLTKEAEALLPTIRKALRALE